MRQATGRDERAVVAHRHRDATRRIGASRVRGARDLVVEDHVAAEPRPVTRRIIPLPHSNVSQNSMTTSRPDGNARAIHVDGHGVSVPFTVCIALEPTSDPTPALSVSIKRVHLRVTRIPIHDVRIGH